MLTATGRLVEVTHETYIKRDGGEGYNRRCSILDNGFVEVYEVGNKVNGELDAALLKPVALTIRKFVNWREPSPGIKYPDVRLVAVAVHVVDEAQGLEHAA